jgi:hypothetical protein
MFRPCHEPDGGHRGRFRVRRGRWQFSLADRDRNRGARLARTGLLLQRAIATLRVIRGRFLCHSVFTRIRATARRYRSSAPSEARRL